MKAIMKGVGIVIWLGTVIVVLVFCANELYEAPATGGILLLLCGGFISGLMPFSIGIALEKLDEIIEFQHKTEKRAVSSVTSPAVKPDILMTKAREAKNAPIIDTAGMVDHDGYKYCLSCGAMQPENRDICRQCGHSF